MGGTATVLGLVFFVPVLVLFVPVVFLSPGMVFSVPGRFPRVFSGTARVFFVPSNPVTVFFVPRIGWWRLAVWVLLLGWFGLLVGCSVAQPSPAMQTKCRKRNIL